MRQGRADRTGPTSQKVEPRPQKVNPAAADQLGQALGTRMAAEKLFEGHGYQAPKGAGHQVHKCGSQGKH